MSPIKTPNEGMDEWLAEEEKLSNIIKIVGSQIVINNDSYDYDIPLADCSTHERILHWVWHLTGKTWMNQSITKRFIEIACEYHGLKLH